MSPAGVYVIASCSIFGTVAPRGRKFGSPIFFGPCTPPRTWGTRPTSSGLCYGMDSGEGLDETLADTNATCGEEIAQSLCLISLGFDEKNLALKMVGVFQGGGESLI